MAATRWTGSHPAPGRLDESEWMATRTTGSLSGRQLPADTRPCGATHTFCTSAMLTGQMVGSPVAGWNMPQAELPIAALIDGLISGADDGSTIEWAFNGISPSSNLEIPDLHIGGRWDNFQRLQIDDWRRGVE
jgi:hypothetical protein